MAITTQRRRSSPPISIIFLNIQSFRAKRPHFQTLLQQHPAHTILLNETMFRHSQPAHLPGYILHRADHPDGAGRGGVAIAVRPSLPTRIHIPPHPHTFPESLIATIYFRSRILHLATIYTRSYNPLPTDFLTYLHSTFRHFIILADLNLHGRTTTELNNFDTFLHSIDSCFIPLPGPSRPSSQTTPDAVIAHNSLLNLIDVSFLPSVGSDHLPVLLQIPTHGPHTNPPPPRIFTNFSKANWPKYRDHISRSLSQPPPAPTDAHSVDTIAQFIHTTITTASAAHIPTSFSTPDKPRLPPKFRHLQKLSQSYLTEYSRSRDPYFLRLHRQTIRIIKNYLKAYHQRSWAKTCTSLNSQHASPSIFWRKLTSLLGQHHTPSYPILHNGRSPTNITEKLEIFSSHFQQRFTPSIYHLYSQTDTIFHQDLLSSPSLLPSSDHNLTPHILNTPITATDISNALSRTRDTAPGPDQIHYRHIRHAPEELLTLLASFYTFILTTGFYPTAWKRSTMLLFPKPGKDLSDPDSYRPICLITILAKILDKVLIQRIHPYLQANHLLPPSQCGFRPTLSTSHQLLRLIQIIANNFNLARPSLLITFDFNKAFDSVFHPALIYKLHLFTLPTSLIRFFASYLTNRTACISIQGNLSQPFPMSLGVPQGSPLSPLLFILFVADIPQPPPPLHLLQFADDTAVLAPLPSVQAINRTLQPYLDSLTSWCDQWFLSLNPTKTQSILLRPRKGHISATRNPAHLRLKVHDTPIRPQPALKYLGVTIDQHLTFLPHFLNIKTKAARRSQLLRRLAGTSWGLNTKLLLLTYKTFIRSAITYGHPAWAAVAHSQPQRYQPLLSMERRLVRIALRLPPHYHTKDLYDIFPFPKLDTHVSLLFQRFLDKALNPTNPITSQLITLPIKTPRHTLSPIHFHRILTQPTDRPPP